MSLVLASISEISWGRSRGFSVGLLILDTEDREFGSSWRRGSNSVRAEPISFSNDARMTNRRLSEPPFTERSAFKSSMTSFVGSAFVR